MAGVNRPSRIFLAALVCSVAMLGIAWSIRPAIDAAGFMLGMIRFILIIGGAAAAVVVWATAVTAATHPGKGARRPEKSRPGAVNGRRPIGRNPRLFFLSAPSGLAGPGCDAALRTSIGCANAVSAAQETGPSPACDARVGEVPS